MKLTLDRWRSRKSREAAKVKIIKGIEAWKKGYFKCFLEQMVMNFEVLLYGHTKVKMKVISSSIGGERQLGLLVTIKNALNFVISQPSFQDS